jgi:hypothetical protein
MAERNSVPALALNGSGVGSRPGAPDEAERRREDNEDLAIVRERRDEPSTAWDKFKAKLGL